MNDSIEMRCVQCQYFQALDTLNGSCHRYPPVFAGDSSPRETHHWRFPTVNIHSWCGELLPQRTAQISSSGATI